MGCLPTSLGLKVALYSTQLCEDKNNTAAVSVCVVKYGFKSLLY